MDNNHKHKIGLANKRRLKIYFQTPKGKMQAKKHSIKMSGRKLSLEHKNKIKFAAPRGIKNSQWKGKKASYTAIHVWLKNNFGKANKCENIKCIYPRKNRRGYLMIKPSGFQWANKSGKYRRDINDWIQLCVSCHMLNDLGKIKIID